MLLFWVFLSSCRMAEIGEENKKASWSCKMLLFWDFLSSCRMAELGEENKKASWSCKMLLFWVFLDSCRMAEIGGYKEAPGLEMKNIKWCLSWILDFDDINTTLNLAPVSTTSNDSLSTPTTTEKKGRQVWQQLYKHSATCLSQGEQEISKVHIKRPLSYRNIKNKMILFVDCEFYF